MSDKEKEGWVKIRKKDKCKAGKKEVKWIGRGQEQK